MICCGPTERLLEAGKKISPHSDGLPRGNALIDAIENTQELALLEEWGHLYLDSPLATPLQAWSWLYSRWELCGEGYEPRLIAVRNDEGLLIGILPFMVERRRGFRRLLFVGTGGSYYLDALVRDGWEEARARGQALGQVDSWSVTDLQQLRPKAMAGGSPRRGKGSTSWSKPPRLSLANYDMPLSVLSDERKRAGDRP